MPPGNPRRQAHPPPPQRKTSVLRFLLPPGNLRRQAHPNPTISKTTVLRYLGQGTMSLAGAGQRPHNHCRQAISADRRTPKKAAVLAPAAPSTHPCPVRSSPQSRAGTTGLLPTRLQPGAPTGKNEKRGRIKRPQRKGVTDNKKSFRGNRERIRKHREKTQPTGSTEKSRAEPSRNQSGT